MNKNKKLNLSYDYSIFSKKPEILSSTKKEKAKKQCSAKIKAKK
jgi:hypothetical protein